MNSANPNRHRSAIAMLLGLSLALALAYGAFGASLGAFGALLKTSGIVLLAAVALLGAAPRLVAWALIFGAAGDYLLARAQLPAGALAFAIGHVCYIRAFLQLRAPAALAQKWRWLGIAVIGASAVLSTMILVPRGSALFTPLAGYTGVLTLMTMVALTLPVQRWIAMAGALLFFISDGFVAANLFHAPSDATAAFVMNFVGWMLYWAGQACLSLGMLKAR